MNTKIKQKWIAALRSGNFKQGRLHLRNADNTCCCLGVLVDICGGDWGVLPAWGAFYSPAKLADPWSLREPFRKKIGMSEHAHLTLSKMNDDGKSFKTIANWIEKNL